MHDDFEFVGPPTIWVVLTVVGGIASALALIAGLEYLSDRLSPENSVLPEVTTISRRENSNSEA